MTFSIITISYNSEKTIERTIKSVLSQTYSDFEYLIIDGASSDGTLNIVRKYEPQFEGRLKWISEPDTGIYNAMNKGIKMSQGEIIGIVNSDDWLESDALQKVNECYGRYSCDNDTLYCGGIFYHTIKGNVIRMDADINSFKRQARLYVMHGVRHPATFVPMNVYKRIGLYNEDMKLSADQDFVLRCYYGGVHFVNTDCVLSNMSEGGLSTSGSKESQNASEHDRKIMLHSFGKHGVEYYWLWYSWKLRGIVKSMLKR